MNDWNVVKLNCGQTRRSIPAYINGELKPHRRSQVARHLATCDACDAQYWASRMLSRELRSSLPLVGGSESGRFEVMWRGIAAQLAAAPRPMVSAQQWVTAAFAMLIGITLALAWSPRPSIASVPTPPTAVRVAASDGTPFVAEDQIGVMVRIVVTQTPHLQGNYAPVAGATDTP